MYINAFLLLQTSGQSLLNPIKESHYLAKSELFRIPIWLYLWHFYHKHATKECSRDYVRSKKNNKTSPEMLIY